MAVLQKQRVKRVVEWCGGGACREILSETVRFYLATGDYIEVSASSRGGIEVRGSESVVIHPHTDNMLTVQIRS